MALALIPNKRELKRQREWQERDRELSRRNSLEQIAMQHNHNSHNGNIAIDWNYVLQQIDERLAYLNSLNGVSANEAASIGFVPENNYGIETVVEKSPGFFGRISDRAYHTLANGISYSIKGLDLIAGGIAKATGMEYAAKRIAAGLYNEGFVAPSLKQFAVYSSASLLFILLAAACDGKATPTPTTEPTRPANTPTATSTATAEASPTPESTYTPPQSPTPTAMPTPTPTVIIKITPTYTSTHSPIPTYTPSPTPTASPTPSPTPTYTPTPSPTPTPTATPTPTPTPTPIPLPNLYFDKVSYEKTSTITSDGKYIYNAALKLKIDNPNLVAGKTFETTVTIDDVVQKASAAINADGTATINFTIALNEQEKTLKYIFDSINNIDESNEEDNEHLEQVKGEKPPEVLVYKVQQGNLGLEDAVWNALVQDVDASSSHWKEYIQKIASAPENARLAMSNSSLIKGKQITQQTIELVNLLSKYHSQLQEAVFGMEDFVGNVQLSESQKFALDAANPFYSNKNWRNVKQLDSRPLTSTQGLLRILSVYNPRDYDNCTLEDILTQSNVPGQTVFCDGHVYWPEDSGPKGPTYYIRITNPDFIEKDKLIEENHYIWGEAHKVFPQSLLEMTEEQMRNLDNRKPSRRDIQHLAYSLDNNSFMLTPPDDIERMADGSKLTIYNHAIKIANDASYESAPGASPTRAYAERILDWARDTMAHIISISREESLDEMFERVYGKYSPQRPSVPPGWALLVTEVGCCKPDGSPYLIGGDSPMMGDFLVESWRSIGIPAEWVRTPYGHGGARVYIDNQWWYVFGNDVFDRYKKNVPIGTFLLTEQQFLNSKE